MRCETVNPNRETSGNPYYRHQKIRYSCADIDNQIGTLIENLRIDPDLLKLMRQNYTQDLAKALGLNDTNLKQRIEKELESIDREEERILRLYVAGNVSEEIWNKMWLEWQDRRHKLRERVDTLESENGHHVDNLDAALTVISKISVLYNQLALPDKRTLVRDVIYKVILNEDGQVIEVAFRPPFTYLTRLLERVKGDKVEGKSNAKRARKVAGSQSNITSCVPLLFQHP